MDYTRSEAKQAARESFKGVWTAITTPFTKDLEVDEDGLRHNVRYVTEEMKVDGIFCTGVMGEYWSLTREEWARAIQIVTEEARGRCLVIAQTGHHSVKETIAMTDHAKESGADFAIMITPVFPHIRSDQGIYEWFDHVCRNVDIGVWMFDGPYTGPGLPAELADRIADIENVVGMKQAWPLEDHEPYHERLHDKIVLSQPSEKNWFTLMRDYGQQVHMSSPNPYLLQRPGYLPMREYTDLAQRGEWEAAEKIAKSDRLEAVRATERKWVSGRGQEGILPVAWVKAWSSALGMAAGPVRPPLENVDPAEFEQMKAEMAEIGLLEELAAR